MPSCATYLFYVATYVSVVRKFRVSCSGRLSLARVAFHMRDSLASSPLHSHKMCAALNCNQCVSASILPLSYNPSPSSSPPPHPQNMDAELFLGKDQEEVEESTTPYQVSRLLQEAFYKADKVRTHTEMRCQPLVATHCTDFFKMVPIKPMHLLIAVCAKPLPL